MIFDRSDSQEPVLPNDASMYKVYPERWWMVISVLILDIANNAHWVAFPSVSQRYFHQILE